MHPILNIAIQAIRKAGIYIIKQYEFLNHNTYQLSKNKIKIFISKIHEESNNIIIKIIKKFYPNHIINTHTTYYLSDQFNQKNTQWIIESIDNHTNFIKQFPFFTLSIAIQHKEHIEIEVIYDPIHNELFSACRGRGAQLNGYRIRLNHYIPSTLHNTIFAIPSCSCLQNRTFANLIQILNKKYETIDFRRTGSIILDLAYVATGRIDGCFIIPSDQQTNTIIIGSLILRESGGLISDFYGNYINNHQLSKNTIAGNPKIIKILLPYIKKLSNKIK